MANIGSTPLLQVDNILVKLECTNPCGSIKDRIAAYIIEHSEKSGRLKPGQRIIEATSGNTGIAFAFLAKQAGYPMTVVMPENMTEERKRILRQLGADLILCSEEGSFAEAAAIRDRLAKENGYFNPDQFSNPLNVECHEKGTGQELLDQLGPDRQIDAFVAGVGTGGTLMGVGRRLRQSFPKLHLVAVEPAESPVMSGGEPNPHGIFGIGDGFIPALVSDGKGGLNKAIDEVITVSTEEAKHVAHQLCDEHGFCIGISSGANFVAAQRLAKRFETVATVFPDGYSRYVSEGLVHCEPGACKFEHHLVV